MALAFNQAKGTAQKKVIDSYTMKNGDNKVRFVGPLLARYVYWIEGFNNKKIPVECLSFDREKEAFINVEKDWVPDFYPDLKCSWAYGILCIDPDDGKVKLFNLKKRLLEQIITAAEDLGDPTDPDTGYMIHFKKVKTGSMAYNVEYRFQPLKCKPEPLTDEEREAVANHATIEELIPRPTADQVKTFLEKIKEAKDNPDATDNVDMGDEVSEEFDVV